MTKNLVQKTHDVVADIRHQQKEREQLLEYQTVAHLISALGNICAANPDKIVDLLSNYLFTPDEVQKIKEATQKFKS